MSNDKFSAMAALTGNTVGETASYQRHAGYSEQDIAEFRTRKDREDNEWMSK